MTEQVVNKGGAAMYIKQISIFLENKSGRLSHVTDVLADGNINIRALSIADTSDFGILRLIVDQPAAAYELLKKEGFAVSATNVFAVAVEDKPGGLAQVLRIFNDAEVNLEYMYAFMGNQDKRAITVCRVAHPDIALAALEKAGIDVLSGQEVYGQ